MKELTKKQKELLRRLDRYRDGIFVSVFSGLERRTLEGLAKSGWVSKTEGGRVYALSAKALSKRA